MYVANIFCQTPLEIIKIFRKYIEFSFISCLTLCILVLKGSFLIPFLDQDRGFRPIN